MSWARISKDNRSRDSELWSDGRLPIIAENLLNLAWQIYDRLAYEINKKKKEGKKERKKIDNFLFYMYVRIVNWSWFRMQDNCGIISKSIILSLRAFSWSREVCRNVW